MKPGRGYKVLCVAWRHTVWARASTVMRRLADPALCTGPDGRFTRIRWS